MTLPRFLAVALAVAVLSGCSTESGAAPTDTPAVTTESPAPAESPQPEALGTEPPEQVIDLSCDDFARVASIGTIAGVTERDPRTAWWDTLDDVYLADVVRNVGGLSCEFSDGGSWWIDGEGVNESWRGAAIFVVPEGAAHLGNAGGSPECGPSVTSSFVPVCVDHFAAGSSWVTIVVSSNDRGRTLGDVGNYVAPIVAAASISGAVVRQPGTFEPPRACAELITSADAESIVGPDLVIVDPGFAVQRAAQTTFRTGNIGCNWESASTGDSISALVMPGGAWAAPADLSDSCTPMSGSTATGCAGQKPSSTALGCTCAATG